MITSHEGRRSPTDLTRDRTQLSGFGLDPFWTLVGGWAVACGALASKGYHWNGQNVLTLALVCLLVCLAWASLWNSLTHRGWLRLLTGESPQRTPSSVCKRPAAVLPFARSGAPAHRLILELSRWLDRWRVRDGHMSPAGFSAGSVWVSLLIASSLAAVLTLLLPARVAILDAAVVGLLALGAAQAAHGRTSLIGRAFVSVALGWLAGHLAFAQFHWPSAALALLFAVAGWGALRCAEGRRGGVWLLDGSQVMAIGLLVALRQSLAAGAVGLLLAGQIVLQPSLRLGGEPSRVVRRTWPWLLATMLIAAWAIP